MAESSAARVAIITGGAGGLGTVMSDALLADGHRVACMDVDAAGLERYRTHTVARAAAHAERVLCVQGDVGREADCRRAVDAALDRFGRVDMVLNNAGIGVSQIRQDAERHPPTLEELTPALWQRFFDINLHGAFYITRAALPHLKAGGWGRIVNVTTSFRTMLRVLPYGATKAALESMAAVWAEELAGTGITVNVLVPGGPADTAIVGDDSGWERSRMIRPAVMGPPIAWLCSPAADAVTGQRFIAARWDPAVPGAQAAQAAGAPIGWPELAAATAVWPGN